MTDANLQWNDYGADISFDNGDIVADNGLASAVTISLFTDARAPRVEDLPEGETSLRGWWGDPADESNEDGHKTGSLLWIIHREKMLPSLAVRAEEYCRDALQWLIDEGIAERVNISASLQGNYGLQILISIVRGNATRFAYLWDAVQEYEPMSVQNTLISVEFVI